MALRQRKISNEELFDKLQSVEVLLKRMLVKQEKKTLVKASDIFRLTVWTDKEKLRQARMKGLIEQVKNEDGIFYDLASINAVYLQANQLRVAS